MITPDRVREDIRCLRKVRENVGTILARKHPVLAKALIVMNNANPAVAARIADEVANKTDAEITVIEMQTVAKLST